MTTVARSAARSEVRTVVFSPAPGRDYAATARLPFEEYLELTVEEGPTEWIDGEVRLYMPASREHQDLVLFLARLLGNFLELRPVGHLMVAPFTMRNVPGGPGREPDLLFLTSQHLDRLQETHLAGIPDLAVEVVSPDSPARDYVEKFREYESAGIPEYWIIDSRPGEQRADFHVLRDGHYEPIRLVDGIFRSLVVEGFWLREKWLWEPERRAYEALQEIVTRAPA